MAFKSCFYRPWFSGDDAMSKFCLNFLKVLPQRIEVAVKLGDELFTCGARLLNDRVFPHQTAILRRDHHEDTKNTKKTSVTFVSLW